MIMWIMMTVTRMMRKTTKMEKKWLRLTEEKKVVRKKLKRVSLISP